jgi:Rrf2 family protein
MGPGGGYLLAKDAGEIRLGDIFRSAEGPIGVVACVLPGGEVFCKRVETCVTRRMWTRFSLAMEQFLDSLSLQDLVDEAHELGPRWGNGCPPVLEAFNDSLDFPCPE